MLAKTFSAALQGIQACPVEIEINASGLGDGIMVVMVGLPDAAVRESKERVASALMACGYLHPYGRTTVNLAPADLPKQGAAFDLPIALGMMAGVGQLERELLLRAMVVGELALDGAVRPIPGALAIASLARDEGLETLILPAANAAEAGIVQGVNVIGVNSLVEAVSHLRGEFPIPPTRTDAEGLFAAQRDHAPDLADVKGQELARRALEVAAVGGHNLLMIGPPGTGKSMLAMRLAGILPPLTLAEALEVTRIHSVCGVLEPGEALVTLRPFRAPHHTISDAGLLGGQSNPHPGEVSKAHNGVLFLDELTEFRRSALEVMRQPLETGDVTISRAAGSVTFPANFQLVAAMNPCPCGYFGSASRACRCAPPAIDRYRGRISGPLLDRIDLHVEVSQISEDEMLSRPRGEDSATVRGRVLAARERQLQRFAHSAPHGRRTRNNADLASAELEVHCPLDRTCQDLMRQAIRDLELSSRAYDRIRRVARTVADLAGHDRIQSADLAEAIQYRTLDRRLW